MSTLIVPCGGKSSRFPGLKPKWMLTHPDGSLMVQKSIKGLLLDNKFDRIIITILEDHVQTYDALKVLEQAFYNFQPKVEFCILKEPTASQSETVYKTLLQMKVSGGFTIKDSDNYVEVDLGGGDKNTIACLTLSQNIEVSNVASKSFIIANNQGIIQSIIEKEIVSKEICVGVYSFFDAEMFKSAYLALLDLSNSGELYVSHIVAQLINDGYIFEKLSIKSYKDWGTIEEWRKEQEKFKTFFIDFDGVLIKNSGQYGKLNWDNNNQLNEKNCQLIKKLQCKGAQIVITTARPWSYEKMVKDLLLEAGITPYFILMGLNHAQRVIVNDFASTNPFPSCISISIPRDGDLTEFLH